MQLVVRQHDLRRIAFGQRAFEHVRTEEPRIQFVRRVLPTRLCPTRHEFSFVLAAFRADAHCHQCGNALDAHVTVYCGEEAAVVGAISSRREHQPGFAREPRSEVPVQRG
jgi:hypothetical protein